MLQFGDHGGAIGYLVGEENRGLEYMFIMMNAARFAVGMQGIAVAERAYQQAVAYAQERVQSAPGRRLAARQRRRSSITPTCAHADDDARATPKAAARWRYVAAAAYDAAHHASRRRRRASRTRRSTNSWCRSSRAAAPR